VGQNEVKPWMREAAREWLIPAEMRTGSANEFIEKLSRVIAAHAPAEPAPDSVGSPQKCPRCKSRQRLPTFTCHNDWHYAHYPHLKPAGTQVAHDSVGEAPAAQKETTMEKFSNSIPGENWVELQQQIATAQKETQGLIELTDEMEKACTQWAEDDRLWTTQEAVKFNLRTFARVILKAAPAQSLYEAPPRHVEAKILAAIMDSLIAQNCPDSVSGYKVMDAVRLALKSLYEAPKEKP
jgi:hypothetical protein